MHFRYKARRMVGFLLAVLILGCSISASATQGKIDEAQGKKDEAQQQLNEINAQIASLESQQQALADEIATLDSELDELIVYLELLANDLEVKEAEIAQAEIDLAAAIQREEEQYQAMKLRIQYIYEEGDMDYLTIFLESKSLSDFLTKADYAQEIHEQDRIQLDNYAQAKQDVIDLKNQLEGEYEELAALQDEYEQEKAETEAKIAEKEAESADFESRLASARSKATSYKNTINEQNAKIKQLQAEQRRAEQNAGGGSSSGGGGATVTGGGNGAAIANYGLQFVGNPYVYGGTSLTNGCDCSGFTMGVFAHFGISLPHSSGAQASCGRGVSYSEAQPGDLICYPGHVAIYIGGGRIVHASTARTGITTTSATYRSILAVRRCY